MNKIKKQKKNIKKFNNKIRNVKRILIKNKRIINNKLMKKINKLIQFKKIIIIIIKIKK